VRLTFAMLLLLTAGASLSSRAAEADPDVLTTSSGVKFVRTPDSRFANLPDWPYAAKYVEIYGLRQAYVDEGPQDADPILLLHGQPSWSYLYRKMIPVLLKGNRRVNAMDHLGMGRSDKPIDVSYYTYLRHAEPGATKEAWNGLGQFKKPFLTIWASNDPGQLGQPHTAQNLIDHVPGAAGQPHVRLPQASHFLQEDQGPEIARRINDFIANTPRTN
jgi:pimeloyl-ACP methyl ester carboxylesterase